LTLHCPILKRLTERSSRITGTLITGPLITGPLITGRLGDGLAKFGDG
jgi:hypothetical protein